MLNFYRAVTESVLVFYITVWFGSITQKETLRWNRVVKTASRIIGRDLSSVEILYQQRLLGRATLISQDSSHPAHDLFEPRPSSRRFRPIKTRTNRFSTSVFPLAVQALSKQKWFFSRPQQTLSDEFLVCIIYHNLLYIILFHILHFKLIYFY